MKQNDKRIRVQVFSGSSSHYRQYELSWRRLILFLCAFSLGVLLLAFGSFMLVKHFYQQLGFDTAHWKNLKLDRNFEASILAGKPETPPDNEASTGYEKLHQLAARQESAPESPLIESDADFYLTYDPNSRPEDSLRISSLIEELEMQIDEAMRIHDEIDEKYDSKEALKNLPSIIPLQKGEGRISDLFGTRKDPFVKRFRHHNGIDIAAPMGTPVYAPAAGVVEIAQTRYRINVGYGRVVKINHGKGIKTLYGHLQNVLVKPGQKVSRWDVIGLVGTTGRSTGPHLHYEIYVNNRAIDPMNYILN